MSNLPVRPYDKPMIGRDWTSGRFISDSARECYQSDVSALVKDTIDILGDLDRLKHDIEREVGHVATREACKLTIQAAVACLNGVRDMLAQEADC